MRAAALLNFLPGGTTHIVTMQAGILCPCYAAARICSSHQIKSTIILARIGGESQHVHRLWKATPTNAGDSSRHEWVGDINSFFDMISSSLHHMPCAVVHQDTRTYAQLAVDHTATKGKDLPLPGTKCLGPTASSGILGNQHAKYLPDSNIPHHFLTAATWICGMHGHKGNRCSLFIGIQIWKNQRLCK
jgi:hypothetical protein